MSKERRLGRGLEALLGRSADSPSDSASESAAPSPTQNIVDDPLVTRTEDGQRWLELGCVDANPYQPRKKFGDSEMADLCDSIREHGFLQPIVVRKQGDRFQLIAGERRLRAAELAGLERVPVQIREVDDRQMAELAIVENVQRKDLNAIEKGASFQQYLQQYGCTQEELATRVNVDRSTIANLIRLLELPEEVRQLVVDGDISQGHARALLPLGDEHEQVQFAKQIRNEKLSVRATESAVSEHIHSADTGPLSVLGTDGQSHPAAKTSPRLHLAPLEEELRMALGTKVDLRQSAKGRGKITIHFTSHEEFDRLQALLTGSEGSLRAAG